MLLLIILHSPIFFGEALFFLLKLILIKVAFIRKTIPMFAQYLMLI